MKNVFRILLILTVLILAVSCSQNVHDNPYGTELVSVSFSAGSDAPRALEASRAPFVGSDYVWYYEASKSASDPTTLAHGATGDNRLPVKASAQGTARKGLTGARIDGMSQGLWDFSLYAYAYDAGIDDYSTSPSAVLVWSGSVTEQSVAKGSDNIVLVSVSPVSSGKGSLVFEAITAVDGNGNPRADAGQPVYTVCRLGTTDTVTDYTSLDAGSYLVTVMFSQTTTDKTAQESFVVNIFGGQTTTVSGTVVCPWQ